MTAPLVVCVVCASSVTRALLTSLLGSAGADVRAFDALPRALAAMGGSAPDIVVLDAAVARAHPETLTHLHDAWTTRVGIVLADRMYSDERHAAEETRALGAKAFLAIPPDPAALAEALRRARGGSSRTRLSDAPPSIPPPPELVPQDAEQMARYVERLWSRLDTLDAYQTLRVAPEATQEEIREAFRARALEFHPDLLHPGLDAAAKERVYQIFKRVSWAFRKVGDAKARREYDGARSSKKLA